MKNLNINKKSLCYFKNLTELFVFEIGLIVVKFMNQALINLRRKIKIDKTLRNKVCLGIRELQIDDIASNKSDFFIKNIPFLNSNSSNKVMTK